MKRRAPARPTVPMLWPELRVPTSADVSAFNESANRPLEPVGISAALH